MLGEENGFAFNWRSVARSVFLQAAAAVLACAPMKEPTPNEQAKYERLKEAKAAVLTAARREQHAAEALELRRAEHKRARERYQRMLERHALDAIA
jgi:hypothetical protein